VAGVGIATVFRHFPTKQALVEATLIAHFQRLTARARSLSESSEPAELLSTLIREMVQSGATKVTLASVAGEGSDLPPGVRDASNQLRDAVADALSRAQDAGAARDSLTVDEVYLLIRALAQTTATTPTDKTTLDGAVDIVLAGLLRR